MNLKTAVTPPSQPSSVSLLWEKQPHFTQFAACHWRICSLATCGALLCCAQLVCICLQVNNSEQCIEESDINWRRKELCHCADIPLYAVHLSDASQTPWTHALLVSSNCPSTCSPELPLSSTPQLMCCALHVCPYCILLLFGMFLPFVRTLLGSPLPHWLHAGQSFVGPVHQGPALLWDHREAQLIFFIYVCTPTLDWSQKYYIYVQTHYGFLPN